MSFRIPRIRDPNRIPGTPSWRASWKTSTEEKTGIQFGAVRNIVLQSLKSVPSLDLHICGTNLPIPSKSRTSIHSNFIETLDFRYGKLFRRHRPTLRSFACHRVNREHGFCNNWILNSFSAGQEPSFFWARNTFFRYAPVPVLWVFWDSTGRNFGFWSFFVIRFAWSTSVKTEVLFAANLPVHQAEWKSTHISRNRLRRDIVFRASAPRRRPRSDRVAPFDVPSSSWNGSRENIWLRPENRFSDSSSLERLTLILAESLYFEAGMSPNAG